MIRPLHKVEFLQLFDEVETRLLVVTRFLPQGYDRDTVVPPSGYNLERRVHHWTQFRKL